MNSTQQLICYNKNVTIIIFEFSSEAHFEYLLY